MDNEQPTGSDADIVSRLNVLETGKPAQAPVQAQVDPVAEQEAAPLSDGGGEEVSQVEDPAEDGDTFDFTADDGEVVKLPTKVKDAVSRWGDATRKTQEAANLRQKAEDRLYYAEAREKFQTEVFADVAELQSAESELQKYRAIDWQAAYDQNPGQALAAQQRMNQLERQVSEKTHLVQSKAQAMERATRDHRATQWKLAADGAVQRIGKITPQDNEAMGRQIRALGIGEQEFKERFADPRIIHAVHKAAKWDALQATKSKATDAVRTAPPVVKAGASQGASASAENKYREARQQLRKSGDMKDAAKLFLLNSR